MCIVLGFSRETESIVSLYVQKEIHVEELASVIMETGEPTSASQAGRLGPGELIVQFLFPAKAGSPRDPGGGDGADEDRVLAGGEFPLTWGRVGFLVLSRPSSDWIGTHQHYGGQIYFTN